MSNFIDYQRRALELERAHNLIELVPKGGATLLDAGTRDGAMSLLLADHFDSIVALDRDEPNVPHARIKSVQGDITALEFADNSFDCVLCAEVLEHIPEPQLRRACAELQRVAKHYLIVGVPYRQDIRVARTTCYTCGKKNPPWGHVNRFDEERLLGLFRGLRPEKIWHVGRTTVATNAVSAWLMDLAGNPYGTYAQQESCVHCGARLKQPPPRNLFQKICTRLAFWLNRAQARFVRRRPNWIHIRFCKEAAPARVIDASPAVTRSRSRDVRRSSSTGVSAP